MTSRENPSRQPPGASQRPVPPPPPRGNVRSSSNRGPLVINTASSESKNNSSGRARNNRWGVRLQHLSPRPPPMVSPFNRVSNRPANLGPGGTPLQSLPGLFLLRGILASPGVSGHLLLQPVFGRVLLGIDSGSTLFSWCRL